MPNPRNNETSVFRTDSLSEDEIWSLAQEQVTPNLPTGARIHGRADIEAGQVRSEGLEVVSETSSHLLHANIVSWPPQEVEQENLATKLALKAALHLLEE